MNYADHIQNPTEPWERFQKELFEFLDEYEAFLITQAKLTSGTINKRCGLLSSFIEYLCLHHPVAGFEDIKFAWCSSGFANYERGLGEQVSTTLTRGYVRDFFVFIADKHGVTNRKLLQKLKEA